MASVVNLESVDGRHELSVLGASLQIDRLPGDPIDQVAQGH
jgi:hypothetical protein